MHDVGFDQYLESFEQIIEIIDSLSLLEPTMSPDFLLQSTTIAVLIDKVVVVGSLEYFDESDNMRGVLYFTQSLYFVDGELL